MTPAAGGATVVNGIIHGKTVELERDTGLPDGQRVSVVIQPSQSEQNRGPGGLRGFGAWADDPAWVDRFDEETRRQRDVQSQRELDP